MRYFAVPIGSVSGVVTAYLVTLAVAMPASGWLGDRFGGRSVLLGGHHGCSPPRPRCAGWRPRCPSWSPSARCRALGGGTLIPVGMTMITRAFPPAERIKANQVLIVPTLLAPALGPVIGGALVDGLSWRWIFYVNLPVGVAALVCRPAVPPGAAPSTRPAASTCPASCSPGPGFPLFMYALSTGAASGWGSAAVLGTGLPGLVLLALFIVVEQRAAAPMLRLRLYAQPAVPGDAACSSPPPAPASSAPCSWSRCCCRTASASPRSTPGLSTFTEALGGMLGVQLTTRLYKRVGPRRLMTAGMCGTVTTIGLMALAGRRTRSG